MPDSRGRPGRPRAGPDQAVTEPVRRFRLTADWVVPVTSPPIRHGAVLLGDDGRIESIGPAAVVPAPPGVPDLDFASAALLPGLVNAHTHLELTGLAGAVEPADFACWIRGVRELKASRPAGWFRDAARQGIRDAFAAGITTVFDTGDSGEVLPALAEAGGAGVVYQEVFGPDPRQTAESLAGLEARVTALRRFETARARLGVSPHAPYTVSGPLYRAVAAYARRESLPIAVHLAESPAESAFVVRHEGPFAEAWAARGIPPLEWNQGPGGAHRSPVAWLDRHGVLGPATLCIHTVQLDTDDIRILADRGVAIAHCPISNQRHGHGTAPAAVLRQAGIRMGVGTDSVISVGTLDLFAEMRATRALLGVGAAEALALGTIEGARLVGGTDWGWLGVGAWADVIAVDLPGPGSAAVEEAVLAAGPAAVRATFASGNPVYRRGQAA